jgi:hypothetical protein
MYGAQSLPLVLAALREWGQAIVQQTPVPPPPHEADTSPPPPVAHSCAGGTATVQSLDGSNTCTFSWSEATPGQTISATASGTPVGKGRLTCGADGTWDYHYSCPASNEIQTCPAGRTTVQSPDGSNTCTFSWRQGQAGETLSSEGTGSPAGFGSLTCGSATGKWSYSFQCPSSTGAPTCNGGSTTVSSPDGSNRCTFTWPQGNPGQTISVVGHQVGSGTMSCASTGLWTHSYLCPNAEGKTCPGGSGSYPSSSGGPACVFNWPLASSGDRVSVVGSHGGTLAGTCSRTGRWINVTHRCP